MTVWEKTPKFLETDVFRSTPDRPRQRIYSPHSPTDNDHPDRMSGEQKLWRAVIAQALSDATSQSHKPEARYFRQQAEAWLTGFSRDFHEVCACAGVNPAYIRSKARQALELAQAAECSSMQQHYARKKQRQERSDSAPVAHAL